MGEMGRIIKNCIRPVEESAAEYKVFVHVYRLCSPKDKLSKLTHF